MGALWIHLDPVREGARPAERARDRAVRARLRATVVCSHGLRHPRPGAIAWEGEWNFRRTDMDLADHVNNAAYWSPLEEELLRLTGVRSPRSTPRSSSARPAQPGRVKVLADGPWRWLVDAQSGEVYASMVLMNARTTPGRTESLRSAQLVQCLARG